MQWRSYPDFCIPNKIGKRRLTFFGICSTSYVISGLIPRVELIFTLARKVVAYNHHFFMLQELKCLAKAVVYYDPAVTLILPGERKACTWCRSNTTEHAQLREL